MASDLDYLNYVLDLLSEVSNVTYKKMMGEYILYKDNIIFGGIYDNRFLIKKTQQNMDKGLKEVVPYPHAKAMYLVDIEDREEIKNLVNNVLK